MEEKAELRRLLSFINCRNKEDVLQHSEVVANELINNWKIVSPEGERRFCGLEFYVFIPGIFEDSATHRRDDQLKHETFYFHTKSKDAEKFSPPIFNRHGVDITCGDEGHKIYGGILIRHLGGVNNRDGSGLALRSLVRGDEGFVPIKRGSQGSKWSEEEVNFFRRMKNKSIFGNEMSLEYDPSNKKVEIQAKKRIGISKTNYAQEKLRFVGA